MAMLFPDQPTLNSAVSEHIYPQFEETRPVRRQLPPEHRQNRRAIRFDSCSLRLANAGTPSSVSGFPALYVFKFEHEKVPSSGAGDREADPSRRIESRTSGYSRGVKIIEEGTPVSASESRVHRLLQSPHVMQLRYHVPCPHCREFQVLEFERLKWDRTETGDRSPTLAEKTARYVCQHCSHDIRDHHRVEMMRAGVWLAKGEYVDAFGQICGSPEVDSDTMVFGPLSKLYSLLVSGFGVVAREFVEAVESMRQGDIDAMKKFVTETLGEVWEQRTVEVPVNELAKHLEGTHVRGVCPEESAFLTTFSDIGYVEDFRTVIFHWMVCAWWSGAQGAIVDFGVCSGVDEFRKQIDRKYQIGSSGIWLPVSEFPIGLDSSAYSVEVYSICDQLGPRVIAMKGDSRGGDHITQDIYTWGFRSADVSAKVRAYRRDISAGDLMLVNSERTQQWRLALTEKRLHPGYRGFLRVPKDIAEESHLYEAWFRQLTSDYKDGGKWKRRGPNEAGDQIRFNRVLAEYYTRNGSRWDKVAMPERFRPVDREADFRNRAGNDHRPVQQSEWHSSPYLISQRG